VYSFALAHRLLGTDGFALRRTSDIVFAQQIAVLEMSNDLITKALQSHYRNRAQLGQNVHEPAPPGLNSLQLRGFDRPELTVVVVADSDGPAPELKTVMWGDIYSAPARDQHSCIVQLAGPFGASLSKAVCYVEVSLPAFRDETLRLVLADCSL
jgi:hypothetical protein